MIGATALLLCACGSPNDATTRAVAEADPVTPAQQFLAQAEDGTTVPKAVAATPAAKSASLLETDWVFTEIDGFGGALPGPPPLPGFMMTREGRRLTGSTACNRMTSGYELDIAAAALRFTKIANTRMMCGRAAADIEEAVLEVMIATDAFHLEDGTLELRSNGKVIARLKAP